MKKSAQRDANTARARSL